MKGHAPACSHTASTAPGYQNVGPASRSSDGVGQFVSLCVVSAAPALPEKKFQTQEAEEACAVTL